MVHVCNDGYFSYWQNAKGYLDGWQKFLSPVSWTIDDLSSNMKLSSSNFFLNVKVA